MQIYHFNTLLNFGMHKGKTVQQLINEKQYSYLIWCLKDHNDVCYTEAVFNIIKDKNIRRATSEDFEFNMDNTKIDKLINERDILELEVINLKKMLSFYKNESNNSHNTTQIYEDYRQENMNWLAEAAGTDDPETMNDIYWNLD